MKSKAGSLKIVIIDESNDGQKQKEKLKLTYINNKAICLRVSITFILVIFIYVLDKSFKIFMEKNSARSQCSLLLTMYAENKTRGSMDMQDPHTYLEAGRRCVFFPTGPIRSRSVSHREAESYKGVRIPPPWPLGRHRNTAPLLWTVPFISLVTMSGTCRSACFSLDHVILMT